MLSPRNVDATRTDAMLLINSREDSPTTTPSYPLRKPAARSMPRSLGPPSSFSFAPLTLEEEGLDLLTLSSRHTYPHPLQES